MRKPGLMALYWGVGLLVVGVFFTLFNLGVFAQYAQSLQWGATILLGLSGLAFLSFFALRPTQWWYLIPGFSLLALAAIVYLGAGRQVDEMLLASLLFAALALAYFVIFFVDRGGNWWAWIPAGSFLVMALVVAAVPYVRGEMAGGLLFAGMAVVFYLFYVLVPDAGKHWWALLVGTAFAILALFVLMLGVDRTTLVARISPLLLVVLGVALLVWYLARRFSRGGAPLQPVTPTPASSRIEAVAEDATAVTVPDSLPSRPGLDEPASGEEPQVEDGP